MISYSLLQNISTLYNIPNPKCINKINEGYLTHNYCISDTNNKKYFFKQFRSSDTNSIDTIVYSEKFFAERSLPIIQPISTLDKTSYFSHEGSIYAMYPFVEGNKHTRYKLNNKTITELAIYLAKIHLAGKKPNLLEVHFRQSPLDDEKFNQNNKQITKIINSKSTLDAFDSLTQSAFLLKKYLQEKYQLEKITLANDHLIHGDYTEQNVFFNSNDSIQYIFDLEKTQYAPRHYELLRSTDYMFLNGTYSKENFRKAHLYLLTYTEHYSIDKSAHKSLIQKDAIDNFLQKFNHVYI